MTREHQELGRCPRCGARDCAYLAAMRAREDLAHQLAEIGHRDAEAIVTAYEQTDVAAARLSCDSAVEVRAMIARARTR